MIQSYVLLGTLGVHSLEDLRDNKITVTITLFSGILGIILHLLSPDISIFEMIEGMFSGAWVILLGCLTGGKIGIGDGIIFILTGLYLGAEKNLALMCLSFYLAGICGIFLLLFGCCKRDGRIPFVPFLFLGYLCMVAGQVIL